MRDSRSVVVQVRITARLDRSARKKFFRASMIVHVRITPILYGSASRLQQTPTRSFMTRHLYDYHVFNPCGVCCLAGSRMSTWSPGIVDRLQLATYWRRGQSLHTGPWWELIVPFLRTFSSKNQSTHDHVIQKILYDQAMVTWYARRLIHHQTLVTWYVER